MVLMEDEVAAETAERIGRIDFSVERSSDSPEFRQRHADRADALAAWLLAHWHLCNPENN